MSNSGVHRGALAFVLCAPFVAFAQTAPDQGTSVDLQKAAQGQTLEKIVVTGSRIARSEVEGPAPVQIVTGVDLKNQGFVTLADVMNALPQANVTQTPAAYGATSVNAAQINLRNLGANRTLLLIDGLRVVTYPQEAHGFNTSNNGYSSFQNYNNIPTGMIDRIEILATGASAIYGSDAVAGVVNVILKHSYDGDDLKLRTGTSWDGGRDYYDVNFSGGHSGENWHIVYNFEAQHRSPIWGKDRPYTDSDADAGYGSWSPSARLFGYKSQDGLSLYGADGNYIKPPAGSCSQRGWGGQFHQYDYKTVAQNGNTIDPTQITDHGYYCAQNAVFENWVLTPGRDDRNAYVYGSYDFGNGIQAYGALSAYHTVGVSNTEVPYLYPGGLPSSFYDKTNGQVISNYFRQLTQAEMGTQGNTYDHELDWDIHGGLKGTLFDDRFNWDVSIGRQVYWVHENYTGLNEQGMFDFFFGPQQGTTTFNGTTYPVYQLNSQRFWNPITPAEYSTFGVAGENQAISTMDQAVASLTGDLFDLWGAGPIGFSGIVEGSDESWHLHPDPRGSTLNFSDPFFDNNTGGGTRQRAATALEFRVPITSTLTATVAGRLDKYHDASIANIARTWSAALEWRPLQGLLLRGSYGTNFHAPDLSAIYLSNATLTVGDYADPLQCIKTGDRNCQGFQHSTYFNEYTGGGRNLLPESGRSWTYGFVWDAFEGASLAMDYWHININNAINFIGLDQALKDDAGCITEKQFDGSPYIAHAHNSQYCQEAIANVKRDAQDNILAVYTGPINQFLYLVTGVDASFTYRLKTDNWGNFNFNLNATQNITNKQQQTLADPLMEVGDQYAKSKITGAVNWQLEKWDTTVYWNRAGSVRAPGYNACTVLPDGVQPGLGDSDCVVYKAKLHPWIIYNWSVGYKLTDNSRLAFYVDNVFNNKGEIPYNAGGFEFIPTLQGASYTGREVQMEFDYKFN